MRIGIVGASGYVGGEVLRLLVNHPEIEITMVTSRAHMGEYLHRVQPSLKGFTNMVFSEPNYDKMAEECDLVFTAVPHGTATEIVKALYDRKVKVIDLSADYRLHNPKTMTSGTGGSTRIRTIFPSPSLAFRSCTARRSRTPALSRAPDAWQSPPFSRSPR